MSTARKIELAPDEVYIQEALKDGRATIQEVSMKALGRPDVAFQARVKHIDMDHVHRLSLIHDQEGKLSPIVVFHAVEKAKQRWIVADGFHRHDVYRRKGERAIRAYVVEVTMDSIEHEARLFAAMCNQVTLLARTPQDVRRAAEMLFSDPECWLWSDQWLADLCGLGKKAIGRYRAEYASKKQIDLPTKVKGRDGKWHTREQGEREPGDPSIKPFGRKLFCGNYRNHHVVGETPEIIQSKLEDLGVTLSGSRVSLESLALRTRIARRGISAENHVLGFGQGGKIVGIITSGAILVIADGRGTDPIRMAVGDLRILRAQLGRTQDRLIAVCYPEDFPAQLLDFARQDGIEFLTPKELVESLKGADGS